MVTIVAVLLVTSTCLYAGFQWTIRVLVYPQFASVPADSFTGYEREHQRRVSFSVAPLFAFFGASALVAVVRRPGAASVVVAGCFVAIVGLTALAAVPQHRVLSAAFDGRAHRRLLVVDAMRLGCALLACAAAGVFAVG